MSGTVAAAIRTQHDDIDGARGPSGPRAAAEPLSSSSIHHHHKHCAERQQLEQQRRQEWLSAFGRKWGFQRLDRAAAFTRRRGFKAQVPSEMAPFLIHPLVRLRLRHFRHCPSALAQSRTPSCDACFIAGPFGLDLEAQVEDSRAGGESPPRWRHVARAHGAWHSEECKLAATGHSGCFGRSRSRSPLLKK